jgi:hypothetical protein
LGNTISFEVSFLTFSFGIFFFFFFLFSLFSFLFSLLFKFPLWGMYVSFSLHYFSLHLFLFLLLFRVISALHAHGIDHIHVTFPNATSHDLPPLTSTVSPATSSTPSSTPAPTSTVSSGPSSFSSFSANPPLIPHYTSMSSDCHISIPLLSAEIRLSLNKTIIVTSTDPLKPVVLPSLPAFASSRINPTGSLIGVGEDVRSFLLDVILKQCNTFGDEMRDGGSGMVMGEGKV